MRIAVVTEYYYPHLGGVCEHVHYFAREARRRGHAVDIITSNIARAHLPPDPHVVRLGHSVPVYANGSMARFTVGVGLRRQMRQALRRGAYDIVHVHCPLQPSLPLLAIEEANCPVVGTFHAYFSWSVGYTIRRRWFQRRLDLLAAAIAVSPAAVESSSHYFDADWTIIPNGVDTNEFNPAAPPPSKLRGDVPAVLFLGRFDPRNGLDTLIGAFRHVRGRQRPAQLLVVGDGPLRDYYRKLAANVPDITFVGAVDGTRPSYYANSALYACPTTRGSFGITLLEAMACATPIVCYDTPGFRCVVANEREALMTPIADDGAMADAIVRLLDDEALRARLGAAGRERALEYSWPKVADSVLHVYAKLLGRAGAREPGTATLVA